MPHFNLLAVIVAALSSFLLGGLWYSKLMFGPAWQRESGAPPADAKAAHPARVFGVSFAFALLAALAYAVLFPPAASLLEGAVRGFVVGLCVVGASFGINYQFANRSPQLWLIDAGYHAFQFTLYGIVFRILG
jgi:hypothetical protein